MQLNFITKDQFVKHNKKVKEIIDLQLKATEATTKLIKNLVKRVEILEENQ